MMLQGWHIVLLTGGTHNVNTYELVRKYDYYIHNIKLNQNNKSNLDDIAVDLELVDGAEVLAASNQY